MSNDNYIVLDPLNPSRFSRADCLSREEETEFSRKIKYGFEKLITYIMRCGAPCLEPLKKFISENKAKAKYYKPVNVWGIHSEEIVIVKIEKIAKKIQENNPDNEKTAWACMVIQKKSRQIKKAADEFVLKYLRLVISIAKPFQEQGLNLSDLMQEGNAALLSQAYRFDYFYGFKFSTYATPLIKREIENAIQKKSKTIYWPKKAQNLKKIIIFLIYENYEPSEIAEIIGIPESKVRELQNSAQATSSLDDLINNYDDLYLEGIIKSSNGCPYKKTRKKRQKEKIPIILSLLTPREEKIIRLRFGINEDNEYTLEEIGKRFSVSRERIRQIEKRALKKLRPHMEGI